MYKCIKYKLTSSKKYKIDYTTFTHIALQVIFCKFMYIRVFLGGRS